MSESCSDPRLEGIPFAGKIDKTVARLPSGECVPVEVTPDGRYLLQLPEAELTLTIRERAKCRCGQVATKRHTYLLHDWENNPKSSGYGKSGVYAADAQAFTCDACPGEPLPGYVPNTRYDWPLYESTFYKTSTRRIDVATLSEDARKELGLL